MKKVEVLLNLNYVSIADKNEEQITAPQSVDQYDYSKYSAT
jgi:hypothetical protein